MSAEIVTPQNSDALLGAVEAVLKSHNLRLRPDQSLVAVVEAFKANQVSLTERNGYAEATMHGAPVHLSQVVEALATKEPTRFYPREVGNVRSRDEMDRTGKMQYIAEHGLTAWESLPQAAPAQPVALDKRKMTGAEYKALPRSTKIELLNTWSPDDVSTILARK